MNHVPGACMQGEWPATVGLPWAYFEQRGCFIDCRGPLEIDAHSVWGFRVTVLTESHDIHNGLVGRVTPYGVRVDAHAWICSGALLAGCWIQAGAIVAAGTVVRGQTVDPYTMVAGNPARVIARFRNGRWKYLPGEESGYERSLE
jgi:acetyltransferase-like isoleucine patch superfamily enzyme